MHYEEINVKGQLSTFVKCFWTAETATQALTHTILPDGYFDLVVEQREGQPATMTLTGIWTQAVEVSTSAHTKIFALRFKPLAKELLGDIKLHRLINSSTILINGLPGMEVLSFSGFADFCRQMEEYFMRLLEQSKPVCNRKRILFQEIFSKKTFVVQTLAARSCMTNRQINRYFNANYGLSLKTYLNIIRCRSTYRNIANHDLYPKSDYFDQAHYIKEIKKYTGLTPKELSRNKNDRFLQLSTLKAS